MYINFDEGYVYLIHDGIGNYKIGMTTKHPKERLTQLQTGNPHKLELSAYAFVGDAYEFERYLHDRFNNVRLEGEWFKLSKSDVEIAHNIYEAIAIVKDDLLTPLSAEGAKRLAEQEAELIAQAEAEREAIAKEEAERKAEAEAERKAEAERIAKIEAERKAKAEFEAKIWSSGRSSLVAAAAGIAASIVLIATQAAVYYLF